MVHIYPIYSNYEFHVFVATRIQFGCSFSPPHFTFSVQASTVTTLLQRLLTLLSVIHATYCILSVNEKFPVNQDELTHDKI